MTAVRWEAVLGSAHAEAALSAVEAIAVDLRNWPDDEVKDSSLFNGHAGMAIFFAYLAKSPVGDARRDYQRALHHLSLALQKSTLQSDDLSFSTGFAGVAWALTHLNGMRGNASVTSLDTNVDNTLSRALEHRTWGNIPGFFEGLAGIGTCLLERLPRNDARIALGRLVDRIESLAQNSEQGLTWWLPMKFDDNDLRTNQPDGEFNLGVAHGVPGIIGFLGMLSCAGVEREKINPVLRSAVNWLLAQARGDYDPALRFPYSAGPGIKPNPARLAWCYGVPGIAVTLLSAADGLCDETLRARAVDFARASAHCDIATSGIKDACLCHGATGIAHIYNRLFNKTGDRVLRKAALFWFKHALQMWQPGEIVGGFKGFGLSEDGTEQHIPCVDFLNGSAGIGLALLAAATPVEPAWDRCLLMSSG